MNSTNDPKAEAILRFEKAVRELIDEGHRYENHQAWLEAAATRAGVDLHEVLPSRH